MKFRSLSLLVCIGFLLSATIANAGSLDQRLQEEIAVMSGSELIPVWITVTDTHRSGDLKSALASAATTREARHRIGVSELKSRTSSQAGLLNYLDGLQAGGEADKVASRWIVNLIEAEVAADRLDEIASRADVETVYLRPQIELIAPVDTKATADALQSPDALGANLTQIRADEAWAMGYTGEGRLVCTFDTGVDGDHPALVNNWKGQDGDSGAAWFDPLHQESFPHVLSTAGTTFYHGTSSTGVIVGHDDITGDTTGVAPDAKWISAGVIDISGASIIEAFEWVADPDGNPNTVGDVPDVINHSWGYPDASCVNIFYDMIDNTEALGIVNIFAAGNAGAAAESITNPADRALDSLDCFAVGNLNTTLDPPEIAGSSSRGPSPCNALAIKPNVVAPGTNCRAPRPNGTYEAFTGTSAAAPHVSGLVALLRQKNPNATVDEIKEAILAGTQTHATFGGLPNNNYGWGEIDCVASLNALSDGSGSVAGLRVYDFIHPVIQPGDVVSGTVVIENRGGDNATNVVFTITGSNDALTVNDGSAVVGTVASHDTTYAVDPIQITVSDTVSAGSILAIDALISADGYSTPARLYMVVDPMRARVRATQSVGRTTLTVTNYGLFGMGSGSIFPGGGDGYQFDESGNVLYEGGLMIGNAFNRVSSAVHTFHTDPDLDFIPAPGGELQFIEPGPLAPQQTWCRFNDSGASIPLGVEITQETFAPAAPNDDIVMIQYSIKNISGGSLTGIRVGLFMDFDIDVSTWNQNAGGYDSDGDFTWMSYYDGLLHESRGIKLVKGTLASAGAIVSDDAGFDIYPPILIGGGGGFTVDKKYLMLTTGFAYATVNENISDDLFCFSSAGPIDLADGAVDTVVFALLAGNSYAALADAASRSEGIPTDVDDGDDEPSTLPDQFTLYQNYPNPFNPSTNIAFDMVTSGEYRVTIFNTLGQTVDVIEGSGSAGRVEVPWIADGLSSGAYFYTVRIGEIEQTRKMLLIK